MGQTSSTFPPRLGPMTSTVPLGTSIEMTLLLLAELGIAGGIGWGFLMIAPVVWILSTWRLPSVDLHSYLWLGPLVVILFVSLLDFPPWATQDGRVLTMAILGLWAGAAAAPAPPRNDNSASQVSHTAP